MAFFSLSTLVLRSHIARERRGSGSFFYSSLLCRTAQCRTKITAQLSVIWVQYHNLTHTCLCDLNKISVHQAAATKVTRPFPHSCVVGCGHMRLHEHQWQDSSCQHISRIAFLFSSFKKCSIAARHLWARLFPRLFPTWSEGSGIQTKCDHAGLSMGRRNLKDNTNYAK